MNCSVQLADAAHVPLLPAVERTAATIFPAGFLPPGIEGDAVPVEALFAAQREGRLWVALDPASAPVGYALLTFHCGLALLAELDVAPAHGRRGLGRALLFKAAGRAKSDGHPFLYLTTFFSIPWNAPFYGRLGFLPLSDEETPAPVRELLANERRIGFVDRIAMKLDLDALAL